MQNIPLFIIVLFVLGSVVRGDECSGFSSCHTCVWDSYNYDSHQKNTCGWFKDQDGTSKCVSVDINQIDLMDTNNTIETAHTSKFNCGELQCPFAYMSLNTYACDPFVQLCVVLDLLMLVWCFIHYLWLRTVAQFPWRYKNVHQVVAHHLQGTVFSCLASNRPMSPRADSSTEMKTVFDEEAAAGGGGGVSNNSMLLVYCPMCRVPLPKQLGHGKVCNHCSVVRLGCIPLLVGLATTMMALGCSFFLSIRAEFDIPFKLTLIIIRIIVFVGCYAYGLRLLRGESKDTQLYLGLMVVLIRYRFKPITCLNVKGQVELINNYYVKKPSVNLGEGEMNTSISQGILVPQELTNEVPRAFREAIKNTIREPRWGDDGMSSTVDDEFIVWWEKPPMKDVMLEYRHLLQGSLSLALISVTFFIIGMGSELSIHQHVSRSTFLICGFLGVTVFSVVFALILASCDRMHLVTTNRLITLSMGVFGAVYMSAFDLKKICCAAVLNYHEYRKMTIVSFQHPVVAGRRLPPLPTSRFVCVNDVYGLIMALKEHAPPLFVQHWDSHMERIRQEYRSGIFAALLLFQGLIMTTYYKLVPAFPYTWLVLTSSSLFFCCFQRFVRIHLITTHVVRNEKVWSLWRLPVWKVRKAATM